MECFRIKVQQHSMDPMYDGQEIAEAHGEFLTRSVDSTVLDK
jgi:hypothetical protein